MQAGDRQKVHQCLWHMDHERFTLEHAGHAKHKNCNGLAQTDCRALELALPLSEKLMVE